MTYNRVYLITYWTFCFRKECSVISQTFVATLEIKFQRSKAIVHHYTQALDEHSVTHTITHSLPKVVPTTYLYIKSHQSISNSLEPLSYYIC